MMTIHKITVGDGYTYLTRHVAGGDVDRRRGQDATDYYTAEGNPTGQWVGAGLAGLGITPGDFVDEAQMRALYGFGWHPDADRIIAAYQAAHIAADMTPEQIATVNDQARRHATLGRQFPVYKALDPYEERVARRLAVIATDMGRDATEAEVKKVRHEESARQRGANAGYDAVFAPVKSAALLWALDERESVRAAVRAAHEEAKNSALGMLEKHAAYTRTGKAGIAQIETRGLVAVAFDHYDSRCGDPNLHTHVVIANKVQGVDGKWRSLDATALYQMTVAASEHYNTTFETALTARLGVSFASRPGTAAGKEPVREIEGVPDTWITQFSKRRTQLETRYDELLRDYRREHGYDPGTKVAQKLARQATLETRDGKKPPRSLQAMRADWREQITDAHGPAALDVLATIATVPTAAKIGPLTNQQVDELAAEVIGRVAAARATWTRWNVHAETERTLRVGGLRFATVDAQQRIADAITQRAVSPAHRILIDAPAMVDEPDVLRRSDGESVFARHGTSRYTSQQILDAEQRLLDAARTPTLIGIPAAAVTTSLSQFETRHGRTLDAGQRDLVTAFATTDTRIAVGIGAAGTGKTTAMRALRHVADAHGRRLIPLATSAASAAVLGNDIGTTAENLHKFLWEHTNGPDAHNLHHHKQVSPQRLWFQVRPGDIILVDEAGMAGTLPLERLVTIAERHGASVRLLGDWRQLGAVESGGALRLIAHDAGAVELDTVHRFANPAEAAATIALRTGDTTALDFYDTHGRLHGGSRQAMADAVYKAWRADMLVGHVTLMIAATNRDITALSARARAERVAAGQVETLGVALADDNLAGKGDWIVTRHNNRKLSTNRGRDWVKNGDAWTVEHRYRDGSLRVRHQQHGGRCTLPADYVTRNVQLHYATTTHRAQGATVDTAHLLVDDQLTRENLYVAITRARLANHAYVATHELLPLDEDERLDRPRYDANARAAREVLDTILDREGAMLSATETIRRTQQQAASLSTLVPHYLHAAEQATTAGYQQLIHSMFDPTTAALVTNDTAFPAVVRALHAAEAAGWQPEQLLATAARRGPLTTGDSPAQLLAWRCTTTIHEHRAPTRLAQPTALDAARYAAVIAPLTGLTPAQLDTRRALRRPGALTVDPAMAAARDADHYQSIIVGVLGPRVTIRAASESAWPALAAAVRRAEYAGHHPAEVLQHAYAQRELATADSLSEVLAWRIGRYLDNHPATGPNDPENTWNQLAWALKAAEGAGTDTSIVFAKVQGVVTPEELLRYLEASTRSHNQPATHTADLPPWLSPATETGDARYTEYLADAREQIGARIRDLALDAATTRPAWTTVFGTAPQPGPDYDTWLHHLGTAAAYRDQHQVTDDTTTQPLGPYIDAGRAGHHAYWKTAEAVIAAHRITHRETSGPDRTDALGHRIAADIYTGLAADERAQISSAMASRLGPLWQGDPGDADTAATQPIHATYLAAALRERGHLHANDVAMTQNEAHRTLTAQEAERLARFADQARRHQAPPTATIQPDLLPPAFPPQQSGPTVRR
ncbi:MobF family relaxase [Micromonospora sp. CA-248212]|uniref:MobF family relaxase n=1 Tax=Micromonospora sp. CA-248212 TaxID=3239961 RepID=UPI003D90D779